MDKQQIGIPEPLNISKLPSLDGLRAISITFVLISHVFNNTKSANLAALGGVGVQIFFVISGFLITTLLLKEKITTSGVNLKKFYIRRAFRIFPLVFLYLFVLFFLNHIFQLHITNRSFITALFFVKNLNFIDAGDWYTGHFWSLAIEEQFYIIFPFFITYLSIKNYKRLTIGLIIFLTILCFCFYNKIGLFHSNRVIHMVSMVIVNLFSVGTIAILAGSFLSVWVFENPGFLTRLINVNSFFLSCILFLVALVLRIPLFHLYVPYLTDTLFAFLIGIVVIMNLNRNNFMGRILNLRLVAQIGVLSYSLYVWQEIFTCHQPWSETFKYADSIILNLAALFLVAYLSYRFYEKKFLDFKAKFKIVK